MIVTTTFDVPGHKTVRILGICRGTTIRARHLGRHILASLRSLVGGEITDYTKVIAEAREQAYDRMLEDAKQKGANAVVGMRFSSAEVMNNAAEILVYGTAVIIEPE
jgi:uncharacterized protein YbjQ (UPF0145 family)